MGDVSVRARVCVPNTGGNGEETHAAFTHRCWMFSAPRKRGSVFFLLSTVVVFGVRFPL